LTAVRLDLKLSLFLGSFHLRLLQFPEGLLLVSGKLWNDCKRGGIETFESCEGGPGHAYPEPTVAFYGTPEAGWRAVGICLAYSLLVLSLRRVWDVLDANEPTGPHWEITFRERF
jgi:hypothetical protein